MKTLKAFLTVLSVICISGHFKYVQPADILVFNAIGTHSTRISMFPYMEALVDKGHKVTFLSSYENFEDPNKKSKINYFTPKKWAQAMGNWEDHIRFFDVRKNGLSPNMWWNLQDMGMTACQVLYSDPEYVNWVKTSKFDVVIMETVVNECALGLVHIFKAKLIVYATSTVYPWFWEGYGMPDETSSIVDVTYDFRATGEGMSFAQRVKNALIPIATRIKRDWTYYPVLEEITRNGLGLSRDELPSFREIEKNVSLVLVTTHVTIDLPRSLPPHVVLVGGAVAANKNKLMSKEIKEFVDSAKKGFIYISFGTVAEFTNFDREVQLEFIKALYAFPDIKFLWKASVLINETLPENVMLSKWVPQQSILAHSNIKAFVTHCGMGSTSEVAHFGVPAILIPVMADQDFNANVLESRGAGMKLEITTLKHHELEHAISEILNNNKYQLAMTKLSKAFKDRPVPPVETAVWWTEYVMRHDNSNEYLVPLSVRQSWWKRRQIDVWLTLGACLLLASLISFTVLYFGIKVIFRSANDIEVKKLKPS